VTLEIVDLAKDLHLERPESAYLLRNGLWIGANVQKRLGTDYGIAESADM